MSSSTQRETALRNWISLVSGYPLANVIPTDDSGPRPIGDFAMFGSLQRVKSLTKPFISGHVVNIDGTLDNTYSNIIIVSSRVSIYSVDGADILEALELSREKYAARNMLKEGDMVLSEITGHLSAASYLATGPQKFHSAIFSFITQYDTDENDFELRNLIVGGQMVRDDDTFFNVQLSFDFGDDE
jgi:hypothetical protein